MFPAFRPDHNLIENSPAISGSTWLFKRPSVSETHGNIKKIRCADGSYNASIEEASSSLDVFNMLLRKQINKEENEDIPCEDEPNDIEKQTNGDTLSIRRRNGTSWLIPPLMQLTMPENGSNNPRNFAIENDSDSHGSHSPPNIINGSAETTPQLSPINLTMPTHVKSIIGMNGLPLSPTYGQRFCGEHPMQIPSPPECIPLSVTMPGEHSRQVLIDPINNQHMDSMVSSLRQLPSLNALFPPRFAPEPALRLGLTPITPKSFDPQRPNAQPTNNITPNIASRPPLPFTLSSNSALPPGIPGHHLGIFPTVNSHSSMALLHQLQAAIRSRRREKVNGRHFCTFPGCMENYASIEHIQDHELQHTVPDGKYLPCPVPGCRERFKWRNYLRVHMKRYHSTLVPLPLDIGLPPLRASPKAPTSLLMGGMVKIEKEVNETNNVSLPDGPVPGDKLFENGNTGTYDSHLAHFDPHLAISIRAVAKSPSNDSVESNIIERSQSESEMGPLEPVHIDSPMTGASNDAHATPMEEAREHSDLAKMMSLGLAAIPADVRAALDGMMQLVPSSYALHDDSATN